MVADGTTADGSPARGERVFVRYGGQHSDNMSYQDSNWWYTGSRWTRGQTRSGRNLPLFAMYDSHLYRLTFAYDPILICCMLKRFNTQLSGKITHGL